MSKSSIAWKNWKREWSNNFHSDTPVYQSMGDKRIMSEDWKTLSSKRVHENPYFSVDEDLFINPLGKEQKYFVERCSKPGVAAIACDGKRILLVNQFRYPVGRRIWQLPAGLAEGKEVLEDAKRELKEETGYTANRWTCLGSFAYGPGTSDQIGYLYLAEDLTQGEPEPEDDEEDIYSKFFTLDEIDGMLSNGELFGTSTLASLYIFKNYLAQRK